MTVKRITSGLRELSPVKKATLAYFVSNLLVKGIAIISAPVFTRIMSTEQYGLVSTYQSWQSVLSVVITLNLAQGVFNNGMLEFKNDKNRYICSLITISSSSTFVFIIIYKLLQNRINHVLELESRFVWILLLSCLFTPAYNYWSGRQRYELRYRIISVLSVVSSILSVSIGIILVRLGREKDAGFYRVFGLEIVPIVLGLFFLIVELKAARVEICRDYISYSLKLSLPLIPHYVSMYILSSSDRLMITKMVNMEATAVYSVAYSVFSIVLLFWSSLEGALTPWIYENLDANKDGSVRQVTSKLLVLYGVVGVLITLFSPEIMFLLAPSSYHEGVYIIPSVATSAFFMAVYSLYMRIELFYKKTSFSAIATGLCAALNLLLNYICIARFGYIAAGYTTLVSYTLLTVMHYLYIRKCGLEAVFDNTKIIKLSVGLILFSAFITFTYSVSTLRYAFIAILLLLLLLKRREIVFLIRQFSRKEIKNIEE